jgi:excisionase family DNA binding protein
VVTPPFDAYLSLRELRKYCGLCDRTLRSYIKDPTHPLPYYRVGGKILVKRSEFDRWMEAFHQRDRADLDLIVQQVVKDLN